MFRSSSRVDTSPANPTKKTPERHDSFRPVAKSVILILNLIGTRVATLNSMKACPVGMSTLSMFGAWQRRRGWKSAMQNVFMIRSTHPSCH